MGHQRFLELAHKYRFQRKRFDGKKEKRAPPKFLSGSDILDQLVDVPNEFGKPFDPLTCERVKKSASSETRQWRKVSIFFCLPYWKINLLRHSLDVMHIEKNVCDNVLYTLLNEPGKSKDNLQARKDLVVDFQTAGQVLHKCNSQALEYSKIVH